MTLKEALKGSLAEKELDTLVKSYDLIGDVIVIRIPPELSLKQKIIAEALHTLYPRVRTVAAVPFYAPTNELYRTRTMKVIWGDERLETTYKESGCIFRADLNHVFLSPRLSYERMRIAKKVVPGETILNMFSGVGCFSILIVKMQPQTKIYSIDVNPNAYKYMKENIALNKVGGRVIPILGEAGEEAEKLAGVADRVLMPLPEEAHRFLPSAVRTLHLDTEKVGKGTGGVIHYYDVSTGRKNGDLFNTPLERIEDIIASAFGNTLEVELEEKRIVRSVGPRKYHVVLDLRVSMR